MKRVPLRRRDGSIRAYALVDGEDYERFKDCSWCMDGRGYVQLFFQGVGRKGRGVKGKGHYEHLHRAVMGCTPGDGHTIDHIDRNKLDNRKSNLSDGDQSANLQNRQLAHGRSKYRGVGWDGSRQKWIANAKLPDMKNSKFLGRFDTEEEAAAVAAAFRAEHMPNSPEGRKARGVG